MVQFVKRGRRPAIKNDLPADVEDIKRRAYQGHTLDQVLWGKILLDSVYLDRNPSEALTWFKIAAGAGYGAGHNMCGRCYQFGWGSEVNLEHAGEHYAMAAAFGDDWGRYNLGVLTMRGLGLPQDLEKAADCFRYGAMAGHAKSMNLYGRFLEEGWGIKKNTIAAHMWYYRSACAGEYRGQHNYATVLLGRGDIEGAAYWWEKCIKAATYDVLIDILNNIRNTESISLRGIERKVNGILYSRK